MRSCERVYTGYFQSVAFLPSSRDFALTSPSSLYKKEDASGYIPSQVANHCMAFTHCNCLWIVRVVFLNSYLQLLTHHRRPYSLVDMMATHNALQCELIHPRSGRSRVLACHFTISPGASCARLHARTYVHRTCARYRPIGKNFKCNN